MSFAESAFLAGILTVAIPIAIHLLDWRKAPRLLFPSLRFLEEASAKTARRNRIHQKAVLLFRAAALAALALALAGPHLRGGAAGRGKASRVLVVDNSASMDARRGGSSALDRSLFLAREVLREMSPEGRAAVMALHDPADIAPALTENKGDLEKVLAEIRPTQRASPLLAALKRAARLIEAEAGPAREILLFSDLQASAFEEDAGALALQGEVRLFILRPAEPEESNQAVSSAEILEAGKRGILLRAAVRGYGPLESLVRSRLHLDGKVREEKFLRVGAGKESLVSFSLPDLDPGLHRLEVRIGLDALPADNALELAAAGPRAARVLVARERGPGGSSRDPAFYLQSALLPARAAGDRLQVRLVETSLLSEAALSRADVVFLLEPRALAPRAAAALAAFVQRGGGLFISTGPGQDAGTLSFLAALSPGACPVSLGEMALAGREPFRLARWEERHPVWAPLLAASAPLVPDVPFFTAYRKLIPGPGAHVLASFGTGDPALLSLRAGRGRVLFFASRLSLEWGNLPLRFLFAPWMHSVVRYLSLQVPEVEERLPGSPLCIRHGADEGFTEVLIEGPGEPPRTVRPVRAGEADAGTLEKTGIYLVTEKFEGGKLPEGTRRRIISVKTPPSESDLPPLGAERLSGILPGARVISYSSTGEALAELRSASAGSDLRRPLLLAAVALLILEGLLASLAAPRRRDACRDREGLSGEAHP